MSAQSLKHMCNMINKNIFINLKTKLSFFRVIQLKFKEILFESKKLYSLFKCCTLRKKFLWFKQNFFKSNKFMYCYAFIENFLWIKEISWLFLHSHHGWEGIGFMWKMTFEIFIKSLRFETPWVRKKRFLRKCLSVCLSVCL